ncbi:MAG TPA: ABC transporter ATP-binding protein [Chitinophagales bacterium]|nr:ABC transporter ATP-binding protein [Chitinophagales bacterium]
MLQAAQLGIGYQAGSPVFSGISFNALPGDMVALLGVNGIGKSTLLRTLSGLLPKLGGSLGINGQDVQSLPIDKRAHLISVVLTERVFIDNITVYDFIALGRAPYTGMMGGLGNEDVTAIEQVITAMHMWKLRTRLFNRLSDGEKQKTLIARALCQQTPVMILDEPTAFLDFRNKKEILEVLHGIAKDFKKVIVFSTHDIAAALDYCNKFWIMTEEKQFREINKADNYRSTVEEILYREEINRSEGLNS